jgi:hypothetical protein
MFLSLFFAATCFCIALKYGLMLNIKLHKGGASWEFCKKKKTFGISPELAFVDKRFNRYTNVFANFANKNDRRHAPNIMLLRLVFSIMDRLCCLPTHFEKLSRLQCSLSNFLLLNKTQQSFMMCIHPHHQFGLFSWVSQTLP